MESVRLLEQAGYRFTNPADCKNWQKSRELAAWRDVIACKA
jgi:hypothetical protein